MPPMKVTLAQINTVVGDVEGNLARITETITATLAEEAHAATDLIVFHEMCLSGYPPKDLVERASFLEENLTAMHRLADASRRFPGTGIIVGLPMLSDRKEGKGVANVAVLICDGEVIHRQDKTLLPTYDVFDEARYFEPSQKIEPVVFKDEVLGISICEDAWNDPELVRQRLYNIDPISELVARGATLIVNISASPFVVGKEALRYELMRRHAQRHKKPIVLVNQIGGNDELVFDGGSVFVSASGDHVASLPVFAEAVQTIDTARAVPSPYRPPGEIESIRGALVLGIRDYLGKCGFSKAVVGLSGGIDSAVTLALAVEALGAEDVTAIAMPSPYSSQGSLTDARDLAGNLGVKLDEINIGDLMSAYEAALSAHFAGQQRDVTEENIQARIRGNLLMAYSNKFGALVLSTGNKSEIAVGYCTLYGDMSGGLAVISDVPKTIVYRLAEEINAAGELIPASIIAKEPSAELRPDQRDSDSLPAYETLDAILDLYIDGGLPVDAICERGFERSTVTWVIAAVRRSEYKRRQAAPGLKVTSKAFGAGRRFPIAARYNA